MIRKEVEKIKFILVILLSLSLFSLPACSMVSNHSSTVSLITDSQDASERSFPEYNYGGDDPLEKLVFGTEFERNPVNKSGSFLIVSPQIKENSEEGDFLKVFLISNGEIFLCNDDNTITKDTSWCIPVAVTYKKEDEKYVLQKYEMPVEGSYEESIRSFCVTPETGKVISGLADRMMNLDFAELKSKLDLNLQKYLRENDLSSMKVKQ